MVDDKSSSLCGLLCKFNKVTWDFIKSNLLQVYREVVIKKAFGYTVNKGFIKPAPKFGGPELIMNWRPTTLLNVSYKIFAKAFALRIKHILSNIICPK
jgi:hypothetical protein